MNSIFRSEASKVKALVYTQLILGVSGLVYFLATMQLWYVALSLVWFIFLLHWSHHAGLHRYFAHNSFKLNKFWHIFTVFSSCLVCFGSPVSYSIAHRTHHKHSDTPDDPHSPKYIGKLKTLFFDWNIQNVSLIHANGLKDKYIRFSHDYYMLIAPVFFIALAFLSFNVALTYSAGIFFAFLAVGYVNTYNHIETKLSYKNFSDTTGYNDVAAGILGGEWHNNHHRYPGKYNQKIKWWEFDFAALLIDLVKTNK